MSTDNYDVDDALIALRDVIASQMVSPKPAYVWVYPKQQDVIRLTEDNIPAVLVSQVVNVPAQYGRKAIGLARHSWSAEILIFLAKGLLVNDAQAAVVAAMQVDWLKGLGSILFKNMTLNGRVNVIGDGRTPGTLFDYRIGHIHWAPGQEYWGIRAVLPVMQLHRQTMQS